MKTKEEYLKGYFTTVDKDGYKRTCQRYKDPVTEKFKRKTVSWKTKGVRSERQALRYLRNEIEKELFEKPAAATMIVETFGDLVDVWMKVWTPTVRETTVDSQKKLLKQYVYPFFPRDLSLKVIKPMYVEEAWANILRYKTKRSKCHLEKATLEKVRSLFKQITYYGYRNELFNFDPQKAEMKIPRDRGMKAVERRKKKFLDTSEVTIVLSCIEEKYKQNQRTPIGMLYLDLVEFMIRNGLRISEVSALTPNKINFSKKKLFITEGIVAGGYSVRNYKLNGPKTIASAREIDLDERSIQILKNRMAINQKRKDEMSSREKGESFRSYKRKENGNSYQRKIPFPKNFQATDYIFQTQNGTPVVYHSFNEFMNGHGTNPKPVTSVMDILRANYPDFDKHVTTHTFRYTHISLLAEAGVSLKAIMERVGHSEAKTTLQIYNQVTKAAQEKVLEEITSWEFSGKKEK